MSPAWHSEQHQALRSINTSGIQPKIAFWVNEKKVTLKNPKPSMLLLDYLREEHGLYAARTEVKDNGQRLKDHF